MHFEGIGVYSRAKYALILFKTNFYWGLSIMLKCQGGAGSSSFTPIESHSTPRPTIQIPSSSSEMIVRLSSLTSIHEARIFAQNLSEGSMIVPSMCTRLEVMIAAAMYLNPGVRLFLPKEIHPTVAQRIAAEMNGGGILELHAELSVVAVQHLAPALKKGAIVCPHPAMQLRTLQYLSNTLASGGVLMLPEAMSEPAIHACAALLPVGSKLILDPLIADEMKTYVARLVRKGVDLLDDLTSAFPVKRGEEEQYILVPIAKIAEAAPSFTVMGGAGAGGAIFRPVAIKAWESEVGFKPDSVSAPKAAPAVQFFKPQPRTASSASALSVAAEVKSEL